MENQTDAFSSYWMEKENPTRDFASFETFLFWFGFCAIRVLSTFGSRYIQPRSMLWANLIGLSLSSIGMFISTNPLLSTLCIFLFGCSIATCFPTAIAFAQTKTDVTGRVFIGTHCRNFRVGSAHKNALICSMDAEELI